MQNTSLYKLPEQIIQENWSSMTHEQQRHYFGSNGFLVIPNAISNDQLKNIFLDIDRYSPDSSHEVALKAFNKISTFSSCIENPKIVSVIKNLFGEEIICFKGDYVAKKPAVGSHKSEHRMALHVDYGIGLDTGDFCNTSPSWLNVAIYLTDMSLQHGPFSVVSGSHHAYHLTPGTDMEHLSDRASMILAKAGDAVVFNCFTVHAGGGNVSDSTQHIIFCSYRPTWTKPIGPVREWPASFIKNSPPERQILLRDLNKGVYHGKKYPKIKKWFK